MCSKEIYVAMIDSGCSFETYEKVGVQKVGNTIEIEKQKKNSFEHGEQIASIILSNKNIKLYDIQIFNESLKIAPEYLYEALKYLKNKRVDVISLSLGLLTNYKEIEELCHELIKRGVIIIASFPRSGQEFVFPASYEGVIAVTSDGICKDFEISYLDEKREIFGANPYSNVQNIAGASVATAKFTKRFCQYLQEGFSKKEALFYLKKGL